MSSWTSRKEFLYGRPFGEILNFKTLAARLGKIIGLVREERFDLSENLSTNSSAMARNYLGRCLHIVPYIQFQFRERHECLRLTGS